MRWSTLVLPVALFYSFSYVNAIPHEVDEKRHWLHKRQALSPSSPTSDPVTPSPSPSRDPQGESSSVASPTPPPPNTPTPSSRSTSTPTPTPRLPSPTPQPSSEPSSSSSSSSSSSISSSSSSSSTSSTSTSSSTSSSSSSTTTNRLNSQNPTSYRRFTSTRELPSNTLSAEGNVETGNGSGSSFMKNKAAMGSTFAIVGLIGVAIIVGAIFYVTKRARQRKDEDELNTYFEKLPPNNQNSGGNEYGLGPSATDLTAPASDQAYMSRDVHYGATNQYPNYNGFEYPPDRASVIERPVSYAPGTAYAAAMSQGNPYHYGGQVEDPGAVPNHPFADPHNRRY